MKQQKKFHVQLNKAIKKGDIETVKKIYNENKSDLSMHLDTTFRFACEGSTRPVLKYLFNEWKSKTTVENRFTSGIDNAFMFLIQKRNDFFFDIIDEFTNINSYQDSIYKYFNTSAMFGNVDVMEYYLKDPNIDPSEDNNVLILRLIKKTKMSANGNNIQKVIEILKKDSRIINVASENDQFEILPDTVKDIFIF